MDLAREKINHSTPNVFFGSNLPFDCTSYSLALIIRWKRAALLVHILHFWCVWVCVTNCHFFLAYSITISSAISPMFRPFHRRIHSVRLLDFILVSVCVCVIGSISHVIQQNISSSSIIVFLLLWLLLVQTIIVVSCKLVDVYPTKREGKIYGAVWLAILCCCVISSLYIQTKTSLLFC